jgi:hypothetical protein
MNTIKYILSAMLLVFIAACNKDYIDPIQAVDPGQDQTPPSITVSYPVENGQIRVKEDITSITIKAEVTDDIEIGTISVKLDGKDMPVQNTSKDYRHAVLNCPYDGLTNGKHTVEVASTDKSGKSSSQSVQFEKIEAYKPVFSGEMFYMPFNGDFMEQVTITGAGQVKSPGFGAGKIGMAYKGATDSYLTFKTQDPAQQINLLTAEFSATFWYKLNATPDRGGILTVTPDNPTGDDGRKFGFRLFREAGNGGQTIKLNAGNGNAESWFDGGATATLQLNSDWTFIAFTVSKTECAVYFNGQPVSKGSFTGIDWTGCNSLSIMSGAPNFNYWGHNSDESLMDELRFYNKALTQAEVQNVMNAK